MQDGKDLTILQINDTHGYLEEHWEHFFDGDHAQYIRAGGYPRISSYIKQIRKEKGDNVLVLDKSIKEDMDMKKQIDEKLKPYKDRLEKIVGQTKTDLNRNTVLESTMDNLLLQSLMDLTHAEIAFSNGWRYGAPIPKGDIKENDLWNIIPVNPPVSKVKLRGKELWDMMEENLERTFAKDPYHQMGGYVKRSMGINLYFKIENPYGERVQELFVQGKPVEKDRIYDVAFVTSQGVPEKYGHDRKNLDIDAIEALKLYVKKYDKVESPIKGSIIAI